MVELFPDGFEEIEEAGGLELVAYTDAGGEERLWQAFGGVRGTDVEADWEDRWRDFHRPVRIGELWIGPPWDTAPAGTIAVVIDPGRAFGTGAHPTTRLCVELLVGLERGSVLDVGCGSGVIGIAAAKLGFHPIVAIDVDPLAGEATASNAAVNGVEIDVRVGDAFSLGCPLPETSLTVANISLEAIEALGPLLASPRVVTSGYVESESPVLAGYERTGRKRAEGWAADLHVRARSVR